MDCVNCKYPDSRVVETDHVGTSAIRRRRECLRCGARFTTHEKMKEPKKPNDDRFLHKKPSKDING